MEQTTEHLLAEMKTNQKTLEAKREVEIRMNQEKGDGKMDSNHEELTKMKARHEEMMAMMDSHQEKIEPLMDANLEKMKACQKTACLEKREQNPEEMADVAAHPENPNGATHEETIGATKDRSKDQQRLAVKHCGQPKKRAQGDGGSWQEFAAAHRWLTRHAVPALCKECGQKGADKTPGNRITGRSRRQQPRLRSKETFYKTIRKTLGLVVVKRVVGLQLDCGECVTGQCGGVSPTKMKEQTSKTLKCHSARTTADVTSTAP
jgi:hypothetical protein